MNQIARRVKAKPIIIPNLNTNILQTPYLNYGTLMMQSNYLCTLIQSVFREVYMYMIQQWYNI